MWDEGVYEAVATECIAYQHKYYRVYGSEMVSRDNLNSDPNMVHRPWLRQEVRPFLERMSVHTVLRIVDKALFTLHVTRTTMEKN